MKTRWLLLSCASLVVACSDAADGTPDGAPAPGDAGSSSDGAAPSDAAHSNDAPDAALDASTIPTGTIASSMFGVTVNGTSKYPGLTYGTQRIWDSPPFQWATLQNADCPDVDTCTGAYDTGHLASFDAYLAQLKTNGVPEVWYTMARTPHFATSAPNDTHCSYSDTPDQGGLGQCDRPDDLAVDGTGTNLTFRKWYAFFAKRSNDAAYLTTHAHVRYWEPWNEPDTSAFWGNGSGGGGSFDSLIRLVQDTACLIVGTVGTGKITKTGETCAQVQASVGLKGPIDPSAIVVSPSYHAKQASLSLYQNFLYCNNSPKTSCTSGDAGAKSIMAFNLHMKPGAECVANGAGTSCTTSSSVEPAFASYIDAFKGILQPAEATAFASGAVPLFDGEASYSPTGFIAPFDDHDMAASFVTRFFLYGSALGVQSFQWYTWDEIAGNTKVIAAWNALHDAWVGGDAPTCNNQGTIYTCSFTKSGASYEAIWDVSQSCSNGTCSTASASVDAKWSTYRDLTGTASACVNSACPISGHTVPAGIKPIVLAQ